MFANTSLTQTAPTETATPVQDSEHRRNDPQSLVFIDSSVSDDETLLTGVVEGVEAIAIDPNQDGIRQITEILQQHQAIGTIHIVSHGSPGCLYLGNTQLNLNNISKYTGLLRHWQSNLSILLYGCNVAAGDAGAEFIHKLHETTNATISASATKTGNAALGGDWNLEVSFPENQETSLAFSEETLATYQGVFTPTLVGEWDYLSTAKAVTVVGNYAYAVGDQLEIIDISDPAKPIFKGSYKIDNGQDVQIVGNYAYVINRLSGLNIGLSIIDISNPAAPILKGNYSITGSIYSLQVAGNYAYVINDSSKLEIIDISDPTAPTFKGNYGITDYAYDVQVVGNYAYVAAGNKGLQIIDISNPAAPALKSNYDTSGVANGVQVVGNYAYVADGTGGLKIIVSEFTGSSTPNEPPTNLTLSNSIIAENQLIGTVIGNFTSTDPDIGNTFIYSLVAGTGATDNSLFTIVGNQIKTNVVFDYETKNSYSVRVRTIDQGGLSYEQTLAISVTNVNDAPIVTLTSDTLANTENDTTVIDSAIIVSDVDSANLVSATISITSGFTLGQDHLIFTNQNGITGSYNSNTGVLTLTGSATVVDYQTALRSITYTNSSDIPSTTLRTISFQVNDGSLDSSVVTRNVNIIPVNDVPVLVNQNFTVNEGSSIIVTNSMLQATDVDNPDAQLLYTLKALPVNGILQLNGINLAVNSTFTQDDINNSRLTYIHNGSETTNDSFNFVVSDGSIITRISTASASLQPQMALRGMVSPTIQPSQPMGVMWCLSLLPPTW